MFGTSVVVVEVVVVVVLVVVVLVVVVVVMHACVSLQPYWQLVGPLQLVLLRHVL